MMKKIMSVLGCLVIAAALSCGKGGGGGEKMESGECVGGGWCGEQAIEVTANIAGAEALFIESSSGSVLESVSPGIEKAVTVSTESPLFSVTTSGIVGVIAAMYEDASDALAELPRLSFVAVSPINEEANTGGHVILVFEHPFIYTEVAEVEGEETRIEDYTDPWSPSSPFTCQIFVVNKKINDPTLDINDPPGLTCITNELELNTWDFRAAMIQFDGNGGVYFSAHVPQNWKNVLLKWTPPADVTATDPASDLSEVINTNICFREFLVTNEGGVLYTGITSTTGDCNGTSFLRYVTPDGGVKDITSGWWEYVFKPIESTDFENANLAAANITAAANVGQILFYGPDPEIATTPDWEDACMFKFNPDASGLARSIKIADCEIDMWQYVDFAPDMATKKTRCTETKSMLGGGNIPEKILLADFNQDHTNYEIYVVGNVYEKQAGEWRYDFCINDANYCAINGIPEHDYADNPACAAAGGTWTSGNCFNQQTNAAQLTEIENAGDPNWQLNGQWCQQPAGDWKDTYSAFAWVIWGGDNGTPTDDSDDTKQIVRLSDDNEIVKNGWVISNRLVYSSFNVDDGEYKLRELKWTPSSDNDATVDIAEISKTDLLTGYEVYELLADPRSNYAGKWFFNGLRFEDNQYVTGTFDPADIEGTFAEEADITGQIETLVIVPNF